MRGAGAHRATYRAAHLVAYLAATLRRGLALFVTLARIMVPVFLIVRLAELVGIVDAMGAWAGPLMGPVGLPPGAGIAFVACVLVGPPAGIAALAVLAEPITVAQASTLATMMLIAHALPVESAIVAKAANADRSTDRSTVAGPSGGGGTRGGSGHRAAFWRAFAANFAFRLLAAYLFGALAHLVFAATGWMGEPVDLSHLSGGEGGAGEGPAGWGEWLVSSATLLATILVVILALVVLLDAMERTGATALFARAMAPVLRAAGLTERTTPLVTIGMLLGLTYGAGLIIREIEDGGIPPGPRALALAWLSLSHSVIEDTGLMLLIGGSLWVTLAARLAFTLAVVRVVALARRA